MSGTEPSLDTQPSADTYELGTLVPLAWEGKVRVPHFQRGFRWKSKDVLRLFDSIVRGYPIGNLLLWVRRSPADTIKLGNLEIDAPATDEAFWVVDGQQRLTSLANALSVEGNKHAPFNVVYDLKDEKFIEAPRNGLEAHQIDVPTLFNGRRLLSWFRTQGPNAEDYYDKAEVVSTKLRQYKVPAYLVRQDDLKILTDIFDRMNSHGRKLNRAEIFSALNSGIEEGFQDRLNFSTIADNVASETLFGTIDVNTVLAAFLARRGPDPTREIRGEMSRQAEFDEDEQTAYSQVQDALVRAVTFLIEEAGVPHIVMLPYRAQLVVLARFFAHFPSPGNNSLRLLRRLFWRLSVDGPTIFRGSFTTFSRTLCSRIKPGDEDGSLQALLNTTKGAVRSRPSLQQFRTNDASTRITLCSWWALRPRSLETGDPADLQSLSSLLGDEQTAALATPYVYPRLQGKKEREMRLAAANRLFIPFDEMRPTEMSRFLSMPRIDISAPLQEMILRSHLIGEQAVEALARDDRSEFLRVRQESIQSHLESFLGRMAEWDYEDTPTLDQMDLDDDEEELTEQDFDLSDDRLR
ncbi:GmrSD restriction endonuclease domain-containing protein [Streptomyces catenulae]|uniref:DUF262 domain-containing protein n=1 Tax=Streptomyces catenulae TaxID=66875 RepID=A0ABV2YTP8_9ACTN|nr:DUF262 domain-containing protein [Streptomyces catenulae]